MRHLAIVGLVSCVAIATSNAQNKEAWGSLSGKIVDGKSKVPVADAIVFLKAVKEGFPIHADDRVRKDLVIQIPAGRTFEVRMIGHFPYYMDGDKKVSTGQKLMFVGDKVQDYVLRTWASHLLATEKKSEFDLRHYHDKVAIDRLQVAAGDRTTLELKFLAGHRVQSLFPELHLHVFAFNHPYFAVTKKDGTFAMPRVPADKEVILWAWQEDIGYLLTKTGKKMTFKEGKNALDIESESPK